MGATEAPRCPEPSTLHQGALLFELRTEPSSLPHEMASLTRYSQLGERFYFFPFRFRGKLQGEHFKPIPPHRLPLPAYDAILTAMFRSMRPSRIRTELGPLLNTVPHGGVLPEKFGGISTHLRNAAFFHSLQTPLSGELPLRIPWSR